MDIATAYRAEIYRPHPDNQDALVRTWQSGPETDADVLFGVVTRGLYRARPGSFGIVIAMWGDPSDPSECIVGRVRINKAGEPRRSGRGAGSMSEWTVEAVTS